MKQKIRSKQKTIFAFGESAFDTKALKLLIEAVRPGLPTTQSLTRPPTLRRNTDLQKHASRAEAIVRLLRAASERYEVIAIVSHRDLDQIEPADSADDKSLDEEAHKAELQPICDLGIKIIAIAPAWEMEAWWLMWPEQVAKHRSKWRKLKDRTGKRVDRIEHAKEVLVRELRPSGKERVPDYSETDAPYIAELIKRDGVGEKPKGISVAFKRFIKNIDKISA